VGALAELGRGLAGDLPAAVLVVLHAAPDAGTRMPKIPSRISRLPAGHARDGEHSPQAASASHHRIVTVR
jgi:two-component system chemotaxis response regulator CheB